MDTMPGNPTANWPLVVENNEYNDTMPSGICGNTSLETTSVCNKLRLR